MSLFLTLSGVIAMCTITPGDHARMITSSLDNSQQPYRLFVPKAATENEPLPLMVVLHGKGVDQNAWFDLTPVTRFADQRGYVVVAPNGRGSLYYKGPGEQDVLDIIERTKRELPIDDNRVYLTGHSMGGWGTWYIGLRHPDTFASICSLAAVAPPYLMDMLPNARHLAPFVIHDKGDDVVPVEHSRLAARRLIELGVSCQYREETGYAHASAMIGDNLPRIIEWFDSHHRITSPSRVTLVVEPGESKRAYWIDVPPVDEDSVSHAVVDATMETPERLVIHTAFLRRLTVIADRLPRKVGKQLEIQINKQTLRIDGGSGTIMLSSEKSPNKWEYRLAQESM